MFLICCGRQFGTCIIIIKSRIGKLHSRIRRKVLGEHREGKFVLGGRNQTDFLEEVAFKLDFEAERISAGRSERESLFQVGSATMARPRSRDGI